MAFFIRFILNIKKIENQVYKILKKIKKYKEAENAGKKCVCNK
jgi:hypothetical protein